jgi:hypothetical protein
LSAQDEFYLWGLLALTFAQSEPEIEFCATPHYCLRQLGVIDQHVRRGGRQYRQFAAALERLSTVGYQNHAFFDPIRGEHRRVSFGLFKYSMPQNLESSRAWRIVWDPLFFEVIRAIGGHLQFDLQTYRELDPATRRLFLFASKIFRRRGRTPALDLRYLGVQVLGFAPSVATRDLKAKISRCVRRLVEREIVRPVDPKATFERAANGAVSVCLDRGPYFKRRRRNGRMGEVIESPLVEPLRAIGVDEGAIARILKEHPVRLVQEWVDITLSAGERFGPDFFRRSPAAFFIDNLKHAAVGKRTPPDWWHELRCAERRRRAVRTKERAKGTSARKPQEKDSLTLPSTLNDLSETMRVQFEVAGQPTEVARRNAERFAEQYCQGSGPSLDDHIRRLVELLA